MAKGKKLAKSLREKLQAQRNSMKQGDIIDNKNFTKMRLRMLPCGDEVPGTEYHSVYSPAINKGCTLPKTFGLPDPLMEAIDSIRRGGSAEDKAHLKATVRPQKEFWMPVLDRDNMGSAGSPNMMIFRCKQSLYQRLLDWMLDEDDGEDITCPVEGRDLRVRKNKAAKTPADVWTANKLDREPISEDDDFVEAALKAAEKVDVSSRFYKVNLETYSEMYDALTGDSLDDDVLEQLQESGFCYTPGDEDDSGSSRRPSRRRKDEDDDDEDEDEDEDGDGEVEIEIEKGTTVQFDDPDEGTVTGTVLKATDDGYEVEDENGDVWDLNPEDTEITVVSDDDSEDEEDEEEADEDEGEEDEAEEADEDEDEADEDDESDEDEAEEADEDEDEEDEPEPPKKKKPAKKAKKKQAKKKPAKKAAKKKAAKKSKKKAKKPAKKAAKKKGGKKGKGKKASSSIRDRLRK
jgi:hypothetical protein